MIDLKEVLEIHSILLEQFGGKTGVRDIGLLESALQRPFSTFDKKDLYPTTVDKASAIIESLLINHPFVDGNKRIGYVLMRLFLLRDNLDISASEDEKYLFVINIAKGELRFDGIREWLTTRLININGL